MLLPAAARIAVTCLIALQCFATSVPAESRPEAAGALLDRLLVLKSPIDDLSADAEAELRRREFLRHRTPPADDAPIETLVAFWSNRSIPISAPIPSVRTRERLLDALDEAESLVPVFGGRKTLVDELALYLPLTAHAYDRVFELASSDGEGSEWDARRWLRRHSDYCS